MFFSGGLFLFRYFFLPLQHQKHSKRIMDKNEFFKTLKQKTKKDFICVCVSAILFLVAFVAEKYLFSSLLVSASTRLIIPGLIYIPALIPLLMQLIYKALEGKDNDLVNRHWTLFIVGIAIYGTSFITNSTPHFRDAVAMLLIFGIGEIICDIFLTATRNPLHGKRRHTPVSTERDGIIEKARPETLKIGDIIHIGTGETVPTDGIIADGHSHFATVTERNDTKELGNGDKVYAGYINKGDSVKIKVLHDYEDSSTTIILDATNNGDWPKDVETAKKVNRYLLPAALPIAVFIALVIPLLLQKFMGRPFLITFPLWLFRALAFTAIACTNSFIFSLPLAIAGGFAKLLRNDIVLNRYKMFDLIPRLRTLVFDKDMLRDNTLTKKDVETMRKYGVKHVVMMSDENEEKTAAIAQPLGIKEYHFDQQPDDKFKLVKHLFRYRKKKKYLAVLGNGVDDKRLLQLANIRIVMTQPDNNTAIESTDIAILNNRFSGINTVINTSRQITGTNKFNFALSAIVKAILLLLAFSGRAPLWIIAMADVCLTLVTSLIASRILKS